MPTNAVFLSSLLTTERSALVRWVARIVGEPAAEDIAQSLYLRVQRVQDHPPIVNKRSFLFRLAHNLAIDYPRAERRGPGGAALHPRSRPGAGAGRRLAGGGGITYRRLTRAELPVDTEALARFLIGKILVRETPHNFISGRIVETEISAMDGMADPVFQSRGTARCSSSPAWRAQCPCPVRK